MLEGGPLEPASAAGWDEDEDLVTQTWCAFQSMLIPSRLCADIIVRINFFFGNESRLSRANSEQ
jgi:hypothetical protein